MRRSTVCDRVLPSRVGLKLVAGAEVAIQKIGSDGQTRPRSRHPMFGFKMTARGATHLVLLRFALETEVSGMCHAL